MKADPEKTLYTVALYVGTADVEEPDYLATVDVDPDSPTYPACAHEMRYPGGDVTSDIWV